MRNPRTSTATRPWVVLAACLAFAGTASADTDWPGFRGPDSDGTVDVTLFEGQTVGEQAVALAVGWKIALGSGYSALAVSDGRVYAMFADGDGDFLGSFDAKTGKEHWRYRIADTYKGHDGSHDGPISTPAVGNGRVYGLGPYGEFFAVDTANGKEVWSTHLVEDHEAKKPHYGFTSSPVLAGGVVAVQIGAGEGKSIAGFDAATGERLWATGEDAINYQSPVVATLGGKEQILSAGSKTLLGIDPADGSLLWSYDHGGDEGAMGGGSIVPVPVDDNKVFLVNKTDSAVMVQVEKKGETFEASELWTSQAMKSTYVVPVVHEGYIYGMSGRIFTCIDAATGERKWRSREPGDGFPTIVGDHIVVMTKPGSLHVIEPSPEAYKEIAKIELFDEHSWSEVAFADGHLFARSMGHLARVDPVGAEGEAGTGVSAWIAGTGFGSFLASLESAENKQAAVDAYLAKQKSFPIVEPFSGAVHFLYRGDAEDVGIVGDMIGFRREDPMTRVPGTDLFYYSTQLEPDAAVTYGFLPDYGESAVADPMNDQGTEGLFGEVSWFAMPAWDAGDFFGEAEAKGRLETVEWKTKHGNQETEPQEEKEETDPAEAPSWSAQVYLPAGYDESGERYPVVYVHGGKDALEKGELQTALDNLVGRSVAPLIAVFILPPEAEGNPRRGPIPEYPAIVTEELIPLIDGKFRTIDSRFARASVGIGRPGSTALTLAFSHPELFAKTGAVSALMMDAGPVEAMVPPASEHAMVIYHGWGTYHLRSPHEAWDMAEGNRAVWSILRERGYRPTGGEVPDGFGWPFWKARTDDLLESLFPM